MISSREVAKSAKSLICLLQSCTGKVVQIELRNDTYCLGTLQSIDCNLNSELVDTHMWLVNEQLKNVAKLPNDKASKQKQVVVINTEPSEEQLLAAPKVDYLFIKGSRIRYIHLPPEIDIIESIQTQLGTFRRRRTAVTTERPFNWKSYRKRQKMEQLQARAAKREQQQLSSPSTSFTPPPPPPPPPSTSSSS